MTTLTQDHVLRKLSLYVSHQYGSQIEFARAKNVSGPFVSNVLNGKRPIPSDWLALIGVVQKVARIIERTYYEASP